MAEQKARRKTYPITRERLFGYRLECRIINGVLVEVKVYPPVQSRRDETVFSDLFNGFRNIPGAPERVKKPKT